jgi:hypothetical protein
MVYARRTDFASLHFATTLPVAAATTPIPDIMSTEEDALQPLPMTLLAWKHIPLDRADWVSLSPVFREHGLALFVRETPRDDRCEPADGQARIPGSWVHWTKRDTTTPQIGCYQMAH